MRKLVTHLTACLTLALSPLMAQADLVALIYHHVSDSTPASTSTTPALFKAQLDKIEALGLEVVDLEYGTREALAGRADDKKYVALTFDDAYESVYTTAVPEMLRRGMPFTIFVNTDAIGGRGYMTWAQLESLVDKPGVTIANHSTDHAHMAKRPDESMADWRRRVNHSLDEAQRVLKERLGVESKVFAYPYGEFDVNLERKIAERGWIGYGQQSGAIGRYSHPTRLPRFPVPDAFGQIDGLKDKLLSRALPVDASQLPDGVITENPPTLTMTLKGDLSPSRLTCFATGQGRVEVRNPQGQQVEITPERPFSTRRFRYNCTYPAGGGRFYWLSQQWLDLSRPED